MTINYDEYKLLELFNTEPTVIDQDADIYKYQMSGSLGLELALTFSVYDRYVTIRLGHNQLETPLYDIEVKNVEEIRVEKSRLMVFKQNNKTSVIEVTVKPDFMIDLSI